jgi:hypothetical protein
VDPVDAKAVDIDTAKQSKASVLPKEIMPEDVENSDEVVNQAIEEVTESQDPVKTDKEMNFERLRKKTERLERELEEKTRRLEEHEKQKAVPVDDIGDDDFVEGRQFKSIKEKTAYLEKRQIELENQMMLKEVYAKYPDIDEIVTKENLEILKELEPEIHESLRNTNVNPKTTYINAYKHVKNYVLKENESKNMKDTQIMKDPEVMAERIAHNQRKSPSIQKASQGKKTEDIFYNKLDRNTKEALVARRRAAMKRG